MSSANATPDTAPGKGPYFTAFVDGRRGEILDAALVVFAEKGYEAGTMREIAAHVGVTEPALYRHYAGKEALLLDLVRTAGEHTVSEADRRLSEVQPDNLRASLGNMLHMRRQHKADNRNVMRAIMDCAPHNEQMKVAFREGFGQPMAGNVRKFVTHVDADLGITRTTEELDAKVRAFMSLFTGYFMTSMFFDKPTNDDAIVDAMLAIMGWDRAE